MKTIAGIFLAAVLAGTLALAQSSGTKASSHSANHTSASNTRQPSTEELNSFMHHMFGYDPNVKWKVDSEKPSEVPGVTEVVVAFGDPVQQRQAFYVASDLEHAFIGQIIPFGADPFGPVRRELAEKANGAVKGNPNGSVEIVEFSDFECPHCKRAWPTLERLLSESPEAKLVFENFPLSSIHKWADRAADYADCFARKNPDQLWKYVDQVYDQQEQITDDNAAAKLSSIVGSVGADPSAMTACADSAETKARVMQQYELGSSLGGPGSSQNVTSTPTLFIAGRKIENVNGTPYEIMKEMVAFEAQEAQKK